MPEQREKFVLINPCFGISGDMFIAALIGLGAGTNEFFKILRKFKTKEKYEIKTAITTQCQIQAIKFSVVIKNSPHLHHSRSLNDVINIISSNAYLPGNVKRKSIQLFRKLASVEKKIHASNKVHLHELASIDSIIDVCGALLALHILKVEKVYSGSVNIGHGTIQSSHGIMPVPAPATSELLKNIPVFVNYNLEPLECTTPTGALILSELCDFRNPPPLFSIIQNSYGAGNATPKTHPNILQASLCTAVKPEHHLQFPNKISIIETSIDDATGEELGHITNLLLTSGAIDCWIIPATGKKGRPSYILQVLTPPEKLSLISDLILRETSSNGVRYREENRIILDRFEKKIVTPWGTILAKFAVLNKKVVKVKADHDSIEKLAERLNQSYIYVKKSIETFLNSKFLGKKYAG